MGIRLDYRFIDPSLLEFQFDTEIRVVAQALNLNFKFKAEFYFDLISKLWLKLKILI